MRLWDKFRVARDADAVAAAQAIAVAGGYSPNCLSKLEAATEKLASYFTQVHDCDACCCGWLAARADPAS